MDYRCPLFEEAPDLQLATYILVVSFGLVRIAKMVLSKLRLVHTVCRGKKRFEPWRPVRLECSQSRWRSATY